MEQEDITEYERYLKTKMEDLILKFEELTGLEVVDIDIVDDDSGIPQINLLVVDKSKI